MLNWPPRAMPRSLLFAWLSLFATLFAAGSARAQVSSSSSGSSSGGTTTGSESISAGVANPERYLYESGVCNGCAATDVTNTPRPQNLNPEGVNFTDCEQDLRMDFTLILSGFSAGDSASVEAWAGTTDCTQDTNRVSTAGTLHACWQVAGFYGPVLATTSQTITMSVYARDVLRYSAQPINGNTDTQTYDPSFNYGASGESSCHVQTSDAAVPISIYFIPVNSTANAIGTAYMYALSTDLVAPPPPAINSLQTGDTLLTINWTSPGTDPDIVGYAVYSDPQAGGATTGGCSCGSSVGTGANSYVGDGAVSLEDATSGNRCMEAEVDGESDGASDGPSDAPGSPTLEAAIVKLEEPHEIIPFVTDADDPDAEDLEGAAPAEASTDGATEAGDGGVEGGAEAGGTVVDSGLPPDCNPVNVGGSGDGGASSCADLLLTSHQFIVNGSSTVTEADGAVVEVEASTTTAVDVDGGLEEGGVVLSGGGISEIPLQYKAGEIDSVTATSLTLTGLTNGVTYHVAVTSIDGSGNVGPVSVLQCGKPGAVNDFWQSYKDDGGGASGCALESGGNAQTGSVFGLGMFAAAAALLRRRRR
jgi:hypothetical protein